MGLGLSLISVIVAAYALFVLGVSTMAASVALFVDDAGRRADAYRVLQLVLGTGTSCGGVVAIAIKLHESGLI